MLFFSARFAFSSLFLGESFHVDNSIIICLFLQATASVVPQLWQPPSGILMTNDISHITGTNSEEAVPCFALSKNDSYVLSASGGMISLFNMISFKVVFDQLLGCLSWKTNYPVSIFALLFQYNCGRDIIIPELKMKKLYFICWVLTHSNLMTSPDNDKIHASTTCCNISCIPPTR